jgi:hypothetical protein
MSTEQYPEISGEESGLVPQQNVRPPEWPKKIRTLTAAELDRLTIDENGHFYWDGRAVFEPPAPEPAKPARAEGDESDQAALDAVDRATLDLTEHGPEDLDSPRRVRRDEGTREPGLDFDAAVPAVGSAAAVPAHRVAERSADMLIAPMVRSSDRVRVTMSAWQAVGMVVMTIGILIGATGIAAYSWITVHEWGCRVGMFETYCPSLPAAKEPHRTDIPA